MDTRSRHVLVECHGCDAEALNDPERIERAMRAAAAAAAVTVVGSAFHRYSPQGVSGILLIAESHLSVHTWPEHRFAALDFFTCGEATGEGAIEVLREALGAERVEVMELERGLYPSRPSIRIRSHRAGDDVFTG